MNLKNYILVFSLLLSITMFGQTPICTDFNSGTTDGWSPLLSNINVSNPNPLDGTDYLRIRDASGASWTYNDSSYPTNWEQLEGHCLCFDYKVFNDAQSGTINLNPKITIYQGANPNAGGIRATFVASSVTVTEDSEWVHVCAPIDLCSGTVLPSNAQGSWTMSAGYDCNDWNTLLTNVDGVAFWVDVAGSAAQNEIIGVDNICIQECDDEPQGETDYCCDSDVNEIVNGNFESGNTGFTSAYSVGTNSSYGTAPGQYYVGNNVDGLSISPLWDVNDHSACTIGSINDDVLFINGKTTQASGTESVVYEQNITLGSSTGQEEKRYKFCANFKNMPQATFDIIPEIDIRVNGISQTGYVTLNNTTTTDPCSWELVDFTFTAFGGANVQVFLKEDGLGDGNDFAMDDISIQELQDPEYSITVQHQGDPQQITGSVNSIDSTDDRLLCESSVAGQDDYFWYVIEVTNYSGGSLTYDINTLGWGNTAGSFVTTPFGPGAGSAWNLTTTFPGYPFDQNTLYLIGLYTPPNPDCCLDEGWTYQLTYNFRDSSGGGILTEEQKDELRPLFGVYPENGTPSGTGRTDRVSVYPNPSSDLISLNVGNRSVVGYEIVSVFGKKEVAKRIEKNEKVGKIAIDNLTTGVYIVNVLFEDGSIDSTKFIKK